MTDGCNRQLKCLFNVKKIQFEKSLILINLIKFQC
jgi:hypothetical protein